METLVHLRNEALQLVGDTPDNQKNSPVFAARLNNLAVIYHQESRFREAESLFKQSGSIWERTLGPQHARVAQNLSNRAALNRLMYEFHEAERIHQLALNIWDRHGWPKETEMAQTALSDDLPLWAEQIEGRGDAVQFRANVRTCVGEWSPAPVERKR